MKASTYNINSWHQINPSEKRIPSKRSNKKAAIVPDVYPQDPKQEEDILSADRLKKGFLLPPINHEHDSFAFNPRVRLKIGPISFSSPYTSKHIPRCHKASEVLSSRND